MSLDFRFNQIPKHITTQPDGTLTVVTHCLIFATMDVGMGTITEDNAGRFYARLRIVEKLFGAKRGNDKGDVFFTPEEVRDHIGLWTNVSPEETDAKWRKRMLEHATDDGLKQFRRTIAHPATDEKAG